MNKNTKTSMHMTNRLKRINKTMEKKRKHSTTRTVALGFALIILIGTVLLTLPVSVREGQPDFFISLFTATSATCVTGLIVADTYTHWTTFGQIVIFGLIQIGGLGFMTVGVYISVVLNRRIGLQQRENLHESVNTLELAGVVRLVKYIVQGTIAIELIGAALLATRFIPAFGIKKGIFFSVFHAVSAFCNGGFDLMGIREPYSSLTAFEGDVTVNLVIMALILIGGIGFVVWDDIARNKWHFKKYLLHTKIVLTVTIGLTIAGAVLFWIFENNGLFAGMTIKEKLLGALFCSVTPRTAGFNTVDTASLSNASKLLTLVYMFIGGSSGSTAGGAKTTTIVVMVCYAAAMLRNREDINLFNRRLTQDVVKKANAIFVINLTISLVAAMIIMMNQNNVPFEDVLFEVFSATGTVGMSTGITRTLPVLSKVVLIFLMYCGRLGSLSFALIFAQKKTLDTIRQPQEKIIVG